MEPGGVSVDKLGNIYISDFGSVLGGGPNATTNHKIFKVTPQGQVSVFASGFQGASGSHFDSKGRLFQSNIRGQRITMVKQNGVKRTFINRHMQGPVGIVTDKDDNLYVANCGGNKIQKITQKKESIEFCKNSLFQCPNGITIDHLGNLYVANFGNGDVIKITSDGEVSKFATIPGNNNGHLIYHKGFLYVVGRSAHQIYKVSLDGNVELFAGSGKRGRSGGSRLDASFSYPNDLDVSPDGKYMYVNEVADTLSAQNVLQPTILRRIRLD